MEQSPASPAVADPAQEQTLALEALKKRLSDRTLPALQLANHLQNHLQAYALSKAELAEQLGLQRTVLFQYLSALRWPQPVQANLRDSVLTPREIQALSALGDPVLQLQISVESAEGQIPPGRLYKRCEELAAQKRTASGNPPVDASVAGEPVSSGKPEKDEEEGEDDAAPKNALGRHGKRSKGGNSEDKTLGELIVSVLIGLAFVPVYGLCWLVHQRGFDDLCELEDRAYDRALRAGPWNVIRRVVIAIILLVIFILARPWIWREIHSLLHPPAANQQNGAPAPATPTPAASGEEPKPQDHQNKRSAASPDDRPSGQPPSAAVSIPVEVHALVKTPDLIRLTWRAVGKGYTYNAYSSASRELTSLRKENDQPLKTNVVDWTPETGLERYWVVVTAVDPQGHESAYSEAIEVARHPEKSGSNGILDAATGEVKKFLPW